MFMFMFMFMMFMKLCLCLPTIAHASIHGKKMQRWKRSILHMWFYQLTSHLFKNMHFTHKNNIPYFWVNVKLRKEKHGNQLSIDVFGKKKYSLKLCKFTGKHQSLRLFFNKVAALSKAWTKYISNAKLVNITTMCLVALFRFCFRKTTWKAKLSEIFYL